MNNERFMESITTQTVTLTESQANKIHNLLEFMHSNGNRLGKSMINEIEKAEALGLEPGITVKVFNDGSYISWNLKTGCWRAYKDT